MRIFKRMLVGISLLTLQLPILWASAPDPVLIYFAITDEADEIFTPRSFTITGVDSATVAEDTSRRPVIKPNSRLKRFFIVVMRRLEVGEYVVTVTVTDKGGLTASKDFDVIQVVNAAPEFEEIDAQGQTQTPEEGPEEEPQDPQDPSQNPT